MSNGIPIQVRRGHSFLPQDDLGIGELVWDTAHPLYARFGGGCGEVNPRYYPGIDRDGSLFMAYKSFIKSQDSAAPGSRFGFDGTDFVIYVADKEIARFGSLGLKINGVIAPPTTANEFFPDDATLGSLIFPLFTDKTLIAQFNRPAFCGVDTANNFRAFRSVAGFLGAFNSTFTRGGSADFGFVRYVGPDLNFTRALNNQPRIVFSSSTKKCRGVLIEPASTNLLIQSYGLDQWPYISSMTVTKENRPNWATKGLNPPFNFTESNENAEHSFSQGFTFDPTKIVAASFFYEAKTFTGTRRFTLLVSTSDRSHTFGANFNAVSGGAPVFSEQRSTGNGYFSSVEVDDVGGGIYRIKLVGYVNQQSSSTSLTGRLSFISLGSAAGNSNFVFTPDANTGNWCAAGDAQLESNVPIVTSYLQTVAATMDRGADVLRLNLSAFKFSPKEGILEVDFRTAYSLPIGTTIFSLTDDPETSRVDFYVSDKDTDQNTYTIGTKTIVNGGAPFVTPVVGVVTSPFNKFTCTYTNSLPTITKLIIDGSTGFIGTFSLISYE